MYLTMLMTDNIGSEEQHCRMVGTLLIRSLILWKDKEIKSNENTGLIILFLHRTYKQSTDK